MKLNKLVIYIVVTCMTLTILGAHEFCYAYAESDEELGDVIEDPWWNESDNNETSVPDLPLEDEVTNGTKQDNQAGNTYTGNEKTTAQNNPKESTTGTNAEGKLKCFRESGKAKVKAATKKRSAKKVKITLKKALKEADGYVVRFYQTKKNAKKNKKAIAKINYRKNKKVFHVTHKKLKNKKTLYIRVRGYVKINGKTYYSKKWSATKKVRIKK